MTYPIGRLPEPDEPASDDLKTITDWEHYYSLKVVDPDGFDRSDPDLRRKLFTKAEFNGALAGSTIDHSNGMRLEFK